MIKLGINFWARQKNLLSISGVAYPAETLVAPAGSSYAWSVAGASRGTTNTLALTVNDIGLPVTCTVDGKPCKPVKVWHPEDVPEVKHFFWAARGAYNFLGNNYTDANRPINLSGFPPLFGYNGEIDPNGRLGPTTTQNGKPLYTGGSQEPNGRYGVELGWDNVSQRWVLFYQVATDDSGQNFSSIEKYGVGITNYPWQATWADGTVAAVATTTDTPASDGQTVTNWRDAITGAYVTAAGSNIALYEAANPGVDLATPALKFDGTDFFSLPLAIRRVFNNKAYCYIFAGAKDTASTTGDLTHGVASINRTSTFSKIGLMTRNASNVVTPNVFSARAGVGVSNFADQSSASNGNYNVLTNESLFGSGVLKLRVNGVETAATIDNSIIDGIPDDTTISSYIGALTSISNTNFYGYMTAVIFAAAPLNGGAPMSNINRARIERFIGLLDGLNIAYDDIGVPRISGLAYPNETLTAPAGSSYRWYVNDVARSTAQSLTLSVNDIGLTVRCVVGSVECTPVTVWHPNEIPGVKAFFWAAQGAYSSVANGVTDANANIILSQPLNNNILSRAIGDDQNGKAAYGSNFGVLNTSNSWCYWNGSQWVLNVAYDSGDNPQDYTYYSSSNTAYPWQATWTSQTVTRQATEYDELVEPGQQAVAWRNLKTNNEKIYTTNNSSSATYKDADLSTPSLQFNGVQYYTSDSLRSIVDNVNYSYMFAGVKNNNALSAINKNHPIVNFSKSSSFTAGNRSSLYTKTYSSAGPRFVRAESNVGTSTASGEKDIGYQPLSDGYNVLTNESLWMSDSCNLRLNGSQVATSVLDDPAPSRSNTSGTFYIGREKNGNISDGFVGWMTAIILASDSSAMSNTNRSRIERFIGLLGGVDIPLV
jgi:hypothetical protein